MSGGLPPWGKFSGTAIARLERDENERDVFRMYIAFEHFKEYGYMHGEWVFIAVMDKSETEASVCAVGQLWSKTGVGMSEVHYHPLLACSFAKEIAIAGRLVYLIPIWVRWAPILAAKRIFLQDSNILLDRTDDVLAKARLPYLWPGMRLDGSVRIVKILQAAFSVEQERLDAVIQHSDKLIASLLVQVNEFPLYYPYAGSVLIWRDQEPVNALDLAFPSLDAQLLGSFLSYLSKVFYEEEFNGAVLFHGPSGTGKSTFCSMLTGYYKEKHGVAIVKPMLSSSSTTTTTIYSKGSHLRELFREARNKAPSIILLDPIDKLLFCQEDKRAIAMLLSDLMEELLSSCRHVLVIAVTEEMSLIDPSLIGQHALRSFCMDLAFPIPDLPARLSLLRHFLKRENITKEESWLRQYALKMNAWNGADVAYFARTAAALSRDGHHGELSDELSRKLVLDDGARKDLTVFDTAFNIASRASQRSGISGQEQDFTIQAPTVYWEDIGGQESTKQKLKEAVEWPLLSPERFERMGIPSPKGILLYGPPGNSKTLLAKALATQSQCHFLAIKGPQLFNKWVGESEKTLRQIFRQARAASPSIIFIDEIDAIGGKRGADGSSGSSGVGDRLLTQLLIEMDGLRVHASANVVVIAATNRPDILDPALIRPGRLDRLIYIPLPDERTRRQILLVQKRKMKSFTEEDISTMAQQTAGYSGAELVALCQTAGILAMEENPLLATRMEKRHFDQALSIVQPRTNGHLINYYEQFSKLNRATLG